MRWADIRSHYARLYARAQQRDGLTQQQIAIRGGLCGNNAISKLLANTRMGPTVETLCSAIEGLGMTVPEFFVELGAGARVTDAADETRAPAPTSPSAPAFVVNYDRLLGEALTRETELRARVAQIELQLTAIQSAFFTVARSTLGAPIGASESTEQPDRAEPSRNTA